MSDLTLGQTLPLRPQKVVWERDEHAECEWCGKSTFDQFVIEAEPVPERFCSLDCFVQDTGQCWSPSQAMLDEAGLEGTGV